MALTNCPHCGYYPLSDKATSCPKCMQALTKIEISYPNETISNNNEKDVATNRTANSSGLYILPLLVILIIILFIVFSVSND